MIWGTCSPARLEADRDGLLWTAVRHGGPTGYRRPSGGIMACGGGWMQIGNGASGQRQAVAHGALGELRDAVQVELLHQVVAMGFDGLVGDVQGGGDLWGAVTLGHQLQHL